MEYRMYFGVRWKLKFIVDRSLDLLDQKWSDLDVIQFLCLVSLFSSFL